MNSPLSENITVLGWGRTEFNNPKNGQLYFIEKKTNSSNLKNTYCDEPKIFCSYLLNSKPGVAAPGDSEGAVTYTTKNGRNTLAGLTLQLLEDNINIHSNIQAILNDLCYYLDYCIPGVKKNIYSIQLGSFYMNSKFFDNI